MISKHLRKLLPATLVFTIAFSTVPFTKINAFAESNSVTEKEAAENFNKQVYEQNAKKVVAPPTEEVFKEGEVTSLRTENSKIIYNGDGKYTKEIYFEPIHVKEPNSTKFEEVSTDLVENPNNSDEVETETTKLDSTFLTEMENGEYATYDYKNHTISFSILEASGEKVGNIPATDVEATYKEDSNQIFHKNIFPSIDLRNFVFNQNAKEDIILNKYEGYHQFTFKIQTDLTAVKLEDNSISFVDENEKEIFNVPAPTMADSNYDEHSGDPASSQNVTYNLEKIEGGYKLILDADLKWLEDPARKFPIFIDPTTSISISTDTYVSSAEPTTTHATASSKWDEALQEYVLRSGYYSSTTGTNYAYLLNPIGSIYGMDVTGATLYTYVTHGYYADSTPTGLWVDRNNEAISIANVTWDTKPTSTNITSDSVAINQWAAFNVTSTVKGWANNTLPNYGFKLHTNGNGQTYWKKITSSANATNKPYLSVDYTIPTPATPSVAAYSLDNGNNEGYIDLSWNTALNATGYILSIFNGETYEDIDIGNVTSWTSKGKGIWPTKDEIANGTNELHKSGGGSELPSSPAATYRAGGNDQYGNTPNYFFYIRAKYANGESVRSSVVTPILPMEKPKAVAKANPTDPSTGYVNLTWPEIPGATGYIVKIWNGTSYEDIDVKSNTSYTTLGEKIWPTNSETGYNIHYLNHDGAELAKDPSIVYKRTNNPTYSNDLNYYFRVISYYGDNKAVVSPLSNYNKLPIPAQTTNSMIGGESYWMMAPVLGGSINAANGNFVFSQSDYSIPSKIFGVNTSRTYNSQSTTDGIFGLGWTSDYEMNIREDANGNILFTDEDGTVLMYDKLTLGTTNEYLAPTGQFRKIKKNANGYILTDSSDNTYSFDITGKLTKIEAIQHLEDGTDKVKETLSFTYSNNKISAIAVNGVNKVTYTYGSNSKVATVTYLISEGNKTWSYSYTNNLLSSVTDPLNNTIKYEYINNVLTAVREPNDTVSKPYVTTFGYTSGKLTSVKDAQNNIMNLTYDSTNKKVSITDFKGTPTDYYYDEYLNPTKVVVDPAGLNLTTKMDMRQNSDVSITDPNAVAAGSSKPTSIVNYDDDGNLESSSVKVDNSEYLATCNKYDENNNLIKETSEYTQSQSTTCSNINTPTSTNGSQKVYMHTYEEGNSVSSVNADSNSTVSIYDTDGNMTSSTKELAISNNMVTNSGMEHNTLDNWTWVSSLNSIGTYSLQTTAGSMNSGQKGVKITPKASTNAAGYQLLKQIIPVKGDTTYTLSGFIKTNNLTNGKAYFNVLDDTGTKTTYTGHEYYPVKSTQDWTRRQITFTTDPSAETVSIYLEVTHDNDKVTGEAYFDDIQLEETEKTSDYNPVENSSFEDSFTSWSGTEPTYASIDTKEFFEGEKSLKITKSYVTSPSTLYTQTIPIYQSKPEPITISGMNKAIYTKVGSGTTYNKIYVSVKYTDDSTDAIDLQFKKGTHDWQRNATTFNNGTKKIKEITLKVAFGGSVASVWFDNIKVQRGQVWSSYEYDSNGLMKKSTNPLNTIVSSTYDSMGNQTNITDGEGKPKNFTYDNLDGLVSATLPNGTKVVYKYDKNGNILEKSITDTSGSVVYNSITFDYNELNELVSVKDPLNHEISTKYDKNGNVDSVTTPNGKTIQNLYDTVDRVTDVKVGTTIWHSFQYDNNSNLTKTIDSHSNQIKDFTYNSSNQLKSQTIDDTTTSNPTLTTNWDYKDGKLNTIKLPGDTNGIRFSYNAGDNNTQILDNENKTYRNTFNDLGKLNAYVSPDGTGTSIEYDSINRITRLLISQNNGTPIAGYQYQYDKRDNVTKITNDNGKIINYSYDENNQLLSEDIPSNNTNVAYKYDEVGNRIEKNVKGSATSTTSYQYNAANQLIKVDGQTYTYDNNGNLTNDGKFAYTWDELNNLTVVKKLSDDSVVAEYKYDDQNRRIYKKVGSKVTKFVYSGDSILPIYETDNNGLLTYKYIYNVDGKLVARYDVVNAKKYYYQDNPHGDVVAVTDDTGAVVASYEYDAWGNVVSKSGTYADENPIRYAGYYYDSETGLYYLIARYYHSINGNFISVDPDAGEQGDSLTQNGYNYTSNNPVTYVDPNGKFKMPWKLLLSWNEIHDQVVRHIDRHSPDNILQEEKLKSGGRVDLLDSKTGEIWDVKSVTSIRSKGAEQVKNYTKSKWKKKESLKLKKGKKRFAPGSFDYKDFTVEYWHDPKYPELIIYKFYLNEQGQKDMKGVLAVISLAAVLAICPELALLAVA